MVSSRSNFSPRLSIIVPVKNGARFIQQAIESIIAQNYPSVEVIIIDGKSSDETLAILEPITQRCPFIKVYSAPDGGQPEAMNKGLKLARGEFIGFLNADDFYSPNVFSEAIEQLSQMSSPAIIVGNCQKYDLNMKCFETQKPASLSLKAYILDPYAFPANPTQYFYHRDVHQIIGEFPENEHLAMDLWFWLEVFCSKAISKKYLDRDWGNFRHHPESKGFKHSHLHKSIHRRFRIKYLFRLDLFDFMDATFKLTSRVFSRLTPPN